MLPQILFKQYFVRGARREQHFALNNKYDYIYFFSMLLKLLFQNHLFYTFKDIYFIMIVFFSLPILMTTNKRI